MPSDLHLDPARLAAHARTAAGLADDLCAALRGRPDADDSPVPAAVQRAAGELTALAAALAGAAAAYERADRDLARDLGRVADAR
ncbi:hypothetical protein BJF78_21750 [Pseudonocardia sp. CNS-139]|nr:hypothetical protein BJF78_21750 [Pseudonocardia sp. CNS-139]